MSPHALTENYTALQLAILAPIYLSPDGAFTSLAIGELRRSRQTKLLSLKDIQDIVHMKKSMTIEEISVMYGTSAENITMRIAQIKGRK